jgi:drug/metabolite transporter (DMT)-like permease
LERRSSATREEEDLSDHLKIPPYVFLILATLFWAGNFTFGRMLSEALPPFGINLIRWIIACVVLVPLTLAREGRLARPPLGLWPALIMMSVAGIILFQSLVYLSLRFTTSTNAALIAATTPVMTLLIAAAIRTDRLTVRRAVGALLSVVGVAWVVSRRSLGALLELSINRGDLIMLLAAFLWAVYTVLSQRVLRTLSPLATTTITTLLALPPLILVGGYQLMTRPIGTITPVVAVGLLYVGIVASVAAFLCWNGGIRGVGAARGAVFLNLIPAFTASIAVPLLGERLGVAQLLGGLLIISGVTLVYHQAKRGDGPAQRGNDPTG